jgi:hypothetical protein
MSPSPFNPGTAPIKRAQVRMRHIRAPKIEFWLLDFANLGISSTSTEGHSPKFSTPSGREYHP